MIEIRDPVHGPIRLTPGELRVVDSRVFQRLRNIKQLGFAEMTFPGATHNRYIHSLGACHLAGRVFDSVFGTVDWLPDADRARLRQATRLAALLHDVGHPPLSHTAEALLAPRAEIAVPGLGEGEASHEDMTLALVTTGPLAETLTAEFGGIGVTPGMVAGIVQPSFEVDADLYRAAGRDLRPFLSQIIASELDVDRMDYLLRDSYFTGTPYGRYDHDWLIRGLSFHVTDGDDGEVVHLALDERAVLTFEDFLLSRYHMFVMVYFHHRTNAYDRMLQRFFESAMGDFRFPADPHEYCSYDDPRIYAILRQHETDVWSRRILDRTPIRRILDLPEDRSADRTTIDEALRSAGLSPEWIESKGVLSKQDHSPGAAPPIFVHPARPGLPWSARTLGESTELFERYREPLRIVRLYVPSGEVERAQEVLTRAFD